MNQTPFSEWLASMMEKHGLNQSSLARRADLSQSVISDALSSTRTPKLATIRRIAEAIGEPVPSLERPVETGQVLEIIVSALAARNHYKEKWKAQIELVEQCASLLEEVKKEFREVKRRDAELSRMNSVSSDLWALHAQMVAIERLAEREAEEGRELPIGDALVAIQHAGQMIGSLGKSMKAIDANHRLRGEVLESMLPKLEQCAERARRSIQSKDVDDLPLEGIATGPLPSLEDVVEMRDLVRAAGKLRASDRFLLLDIAKRLLENRESGRANGGGK